MKIILKKRAAKSISSIAIYISNEGYPETAIKYVKRLKSFIDSLAEYPDKYPISRHKAFSRHGLRQAVFEKKYIILYKIVEEELVVYNIIHVSRIR